MQKTNRVRLVLDVEYDLEDETIQTMVENVQMQINHAIWNGMLSGDTSATVEKYTASVTAIPAKADAIGANLDDALEFVLQMAASHIEDIESGIQDGTYDPDDNHDINAKNAAHEAVSALQTRVAACLDACDGVQTEVLQEIGTGAMSRQRDRANLDRSLFRDVREMLVALTNQANAVINSPEDDEQEYTDLLASLEDANRLISATQEDDVGRPAGQLVKFIEQVAAFKKWGDGSNEMDDDPSDGTDDSHACLMDLIDQARDILKP